MNRISLVVCYALLVSSCCSYAPWSAWRYEPDTKYKSITTSTFYVERNTAPEYFVNNALVSASINADNASTKSGGPPYSSTISVTTKNQKPSLVEVHSVEIVDSNGKLYDYTPIMINSGDGFHSYSYLTLPVPGFTESLRLHKPSEETKQYMKYTLFSERTMYLTPANGASVNMLIDVEISGESTSERKTLKYVFSPKNESGRLVCASV